MVGSTRATITRRLQALSPELVADALDELKIHARVLNASVSGIKSLNWARPLCGCVYTVLFVDMDDPRPAIGAHTRDYLNDVPVGVVVVIHNEAGVAFSTWGGLLCRYASKNGILGTITDGSVRDVDDIAALNYPVFAANATCQRGTGRYKVVAVQAAIRINDVEIKPDDYIIASNSGIVLIEDKVVDDVLSIAERNKAREEKITRLINKGLTLFQIDEAMHKEDLSQPKSVSDKKSL